MTEIMSLVECWLPDIKHSKFMIPFNGILNSIHIDTNNRHFLNCKISDERGDLPINIQLNNVYNGIIRANLLKPVQISKYIVIQLDIDEIPTTDFELTIKVIGRK